MMDTGHIVDAVVIVLLAATIFFAFRLERRLASVRNAQDALASVIRDLNMAASRAEAGIQGLKATAESSGQTLDDRIRRARGVADELGLLLQAGQRSAQALDMVRPGAAKPAPRAQVPAPRAFAAR